MRSTSAPRVRFEIHVPDQVVGVGGRITDPMQNAGRPVEMTFTNESDRVLWINTRAKALPSPVPGMSEVALTIAGPSGHLPFYCMDKGSPADIHDYALLRPGERVTLKEDSLWCYYDLFAKPGTYKAWAVYQDRNPEPPPAPSRAEGVYEELVAQPVQFQVVAK